MKLSQDSWHARLFKQAFIIDRNWIEMIINLFSRKKEVVISAKTRRLEKKCRRIKLAIDQLETEGAVKTKKMRRLSLSFRFNQAKMAKSYREDVEAHEEQIYQAKKGRIRTNRSIQRGGKLTVEYFLKLLFAITFYLPLIKGNACARRLLHPFSVTSESFANAIEE